MWSRQDNDRKANLGSMSSRLARVWLWSRETMGHISRKVRLGLIEEGLECQSETLGVSSKTKGILNPKA